MWSGYLAYRQGWLQGCLTSAYNDWCNALEGVETVQKCTWGKVVWAGLVWNKTINHDLYLYQWKPFYTDTNKAPFTVTPIKPLLPWHQCMPFYHGINEGFIIMKPKGDILLLWITPIVHISVLFKQMYIMVIRHSQLAQIPWEVHSNESLSLVTYSHPHIVSPNPLGCTQQWVIELSHMTDSHCLSNASSSMFGLDKRQLIVGKVW